MATTMSATRKRRAPTPPSSPSVDFGPDIRRRDIAVPARTRTVGGVVEVVSPGYTREANVVQGTWPDPINPERGFDVRGAISWLPLQMYRAGTLTTAQVVAASRYRDNLDMAEGCSDRQAGVGHSAPWSRVGVTMTMLQAREAIARADKAMGAETARIVRAFVTMDTMSGVGLAIGVDRKRVSVAVVRALDELDHWWGNG